ncbi:MAG: hypothetical protein ACJAVV_001668 [Alphaproteobacteria bacterium]|jgi:hypothetical protein
MNFFESQAKARNQTKTLVFLFGVAVLSLIVLTNLLVMGVFGYFGLDGQAITLQYIVDQFHWKVFTAISIVVLIFIFVASLYKISTLSGGGKVVAKSLGGSLINHSTDNL